MALGRSVELNIQRPASRAVVNLILRAVAQWEIIVAICSFMLAAAYFLYLAFVTRHLFWDAKIYAAAAKALQAGVSPYDFTYLHNKFGILNPYVYPPFVAHLFSKIGWLLFSPIGFSAILLIHILCWLAIPFLLAGSPTNWYSRHFAYVWGLYLTLFGMAGTRLLVVGNIASILLGILIYSTVKAVRSGDYKLFWLVLIAVSYVKFYLLIFLIFPVVLDKKYIGAIVAISLVVILLSIDWAFEPDLFHQFIAQMKADAQGGAVAGWSLFALVSLAVRSGFGLFDPMAHIIMIAFELVSIAIVLLLAHEISDRRQRPIRFDLFCCWLLLSAFLISPRLFDYDLAVVVVPVTLLAQMLLTQKGFGIAVAIFVVGCASVFMRTPADFPVMLSEWGGTFIILGVWLGAAVQWLDEDHAATNDRHLSSAPVFSAPRQ